MEIKSIQNFETKENSKKLIGRKRNPHENIDDIFKILYDDNNEFKLFNGNFLKPEILDIYKDKNEKFFIDYNFENDENWLKCVDKKEKEWFGKDCYFNKHNESCKKECNNGPNINIKYSITEKMEVEF